MVGRYGNMPEAVGTPARPVATGGGEPARHWPNGIAFAAILFAVTFALNLSDYMSRYVVVALFDDLQREWSLSRAQLGGLVSVVATAVGFLAIPVALLSESIGKARSLALMALLWSGATWFSAHAMSYEQLLGSRIVVGIGEAAYSSVGLALLLGYFPVSMRASVSATFLASGPLGQMLGIFVGSQIAASHGWRPAFSAMAGLGLVLAVLFLLIAGKTHEKQAQGAEADRPGIVAVAREVLSRRAVAFAMLGSGLQLFAFAGFMAWAPSWLRSAYALAPVDAAKGGALLVLVGTLGMPSCALLADWLAARHAHGRARAAMLLCAITGVTFAAGFLLHPGPLQLLLMGCGVFTGGAAVGPASAIFAQNLRPAIHGVAFSCGTVANNLIGQGPSPWLIGKLADSSTLPVALSLSSVASLLGCVAFLLSMGGARNSTSDDPAQGPQTC